MCTDIFTCTRDYFLNKWAEVVDDHTDMDSGGSRPERRLLVTRLALGRGWCLIISQFYFVIFVLSLFQQTNKQANQQTNNKVAHREGGETYLWEVHRPSSWGGISTSTCRCVTRRKMALQLRSFQSSRYTWCGATSCGVAMAPATHSGCSVKTMNSHPNMDSAPCDCESRILNIHWLKTVFCVYLPDPTSWGHDITIGHLKCVAVAQNLVWIWRL